MHKDILIKYVVIFFIISLNIMILAVLIMNVKSIMNEIEIKNSGKEIINSNAGYESNNGIIDSNNDNNLEMEQILKVILIVISIVLIILSFIIFKKIKC